MKKIPLMINGLPGNVSRTMARAAAPDPRFDLVPFSLTGPEMSQPNDTAGKIDIQLIPPDRRDKVMSEILAQYPGMIAVDFTHPTAVNDNARFYTRHRIPFVMGTTGGDRVALSDTVAHSPIPAVIAPNMAKQVVGFQAMMAYAADRFPGLFHGYTLDIRESHQQTKVDTSGTAKAMVGYFNQLGIPFSPDRIQKVRDPHIQQTDLNVPEAHLSGHGWHTYTLTSPDGSARFEFTHNVNGRRMYVDGTFDAVLFLKEKMTDSATAGRVFTMIDVLAHSS